MWSDLVQTLARPGVAAFYQVAESNKSRAVFTMAPRFGVARAHDLHSLLSNVHSYAMKVFGKKTSSVTSDADNPRELAALRTTRWPGRDDRTGRIYVKLRRIPNGSAGDHSVGKARGQTPRLPSTQSATSSKLRHRRYDVPGIGLPREEYGTHSLFRTGFFRPHEDREHCQTPRVDVEAALRLAEATDI